MTECLEQGMSPDRLQPYEMSVFAEIVRETRHNRLPLNEMPMHNSMLKK